MKNWMGLLYFIFIMVVGCKSDQNAKIEVVKLIETSKSWNGALLPKYLEGNPKVTILKITIPPNTRLKKHKHLEINAGVLLKGELTVISEHKDTLHLKEGDPIVELVDTWHYGINEGKTPAEILVFYAGVEGTPLTVLE